jgi:prepilin-type N-terminal cleavage/methylation domain-containing protein
MRAKRTSRHGFTLLETVVAIAVCAIVLTALFGVNVSSLQQSRAGGLKVQATQVLDSVGRRVVAGGDTDLLPGSGASVAYDYGDLDALLDLGADATGRFRASVTHDGTLSVGDSTLVRYRIEACYQAAGGERCVAATTLARSGS